MVVAGAGNGAEPSDGAGPATAVVADRVPLVRLGLDASLRAAGVVTVGHAEDLDAGVEAAVAARATLLVVGGVDASSAGPLARHVGRLGATRLVVLVGRPDRDTLVALLEAGADAVALRTIPPDDFGALVGRVLAGERSVGPALMSVLLDLVRDRSVPAGPDPSRTGAGATVTVPTVPAPTAGGDAPGGLTVKELQVLTRLAHGESNAEIAAALFVSTATVKTHLAHIYAKLGVGTRHAAMSRAVALGILHGSGSELR